MVRDPLARKFGYFVGRLWALLEAWWPGILEAAGLAGWMAGGQGSTGQKVWLPSTTIFDLIEYTIELGRP